jgi:hypothetical protein
VALSASLRTKLGLSSEITHLSVDGAHRTAALRFLIDSNDPRDAFFTEDYKFRVHVLHNYTDAMQRALSSRKCLLCRFFFSHSKGDVYGNLIYGGGNISSRYIGPPVYEISIYVAFSTKTYLIFSPPNPFFCPRSRLPTYHRALITFPKKIRLRLQRGVKNIF